ncbi:MAG: isoprenylcysteine carboxylmethyltransferase family protein [Myxococcota bacterium]
MRIRRRRLRSALVLVGCLVGDVPFVGHPGGGAAVMAATRLGVALVLIAAGSALHVWSKGCLEQNRRLVTAGPYRFTRNPFYLANGLVDLGLCALIGRGWVGGPYLAFWWLAYRDTIGREEARLAALFPAEVERYFARVPRLLPSGRVLARAEAVGRFRFGNPALARGGEYARILGFGVAAAAIAASAWLRTTGLAAFAPLHAPGLAVVLLVPVAWVAKLALAEVFRRPDSALLPFDDRPGVRAGVTLGCVAAIAALMAGGATGYGAGLVWLVAWPALWLVLAGLDAGARVRVRRAAAEASAGDATGAGGSAARRRERWALRSRIGLYAAVALVVTAVLRRMA